MNNRRILVVEDERLVARDISMQLRDLGYEPLGPAYTGEQAIEMAESFRPDLVLMDVHLGSAMDGIDAAQTIRTTVGSPTIYLSAFTDPTNLERANLTEPAGYLGKPFSEHELRNAITEALK